MMFSVLVERYHGPFVARLVGKEFTRMVRPTPDEALAAMALERQQCVGRVDLAPRGGFSAVAGEFGDAPTPSELRAFNAP